MGSDTDNRWRRWPALAAALVVLDAALTFENAWPTPGIRWRGELSIELAAFILLFVTISHRVQPRLHAVVRFVAVIWALLAVGRYADVTAPALYGRDVNLYWDLQYIPDVAAMLTRAVPSWLLLVIAGAVAVSAILLYVLMRWAITQVAGAVSRPAERRVLVAGALALILGVAVQAATRRQPLDAFAAETKPWFPTPVTASYLRQTGLALSALTKSVPLPPSPSMTSDLSLVKGADVVLIFIESYGAVTYDRPEFATRLAARRAALEAAVRATHRDVVSTFVQSPTFGGSSWLAHISLLSGIEVRDPHTNAQLMTEKRDTMATAFSRRGFRTIAWMPGLRQAWPEGRFYGFTDIYNAGRLDYHGPEFGWFAIPDQYSIARLDELELNRLARDPVFVFFPTLSTHVPFGPTPVYQPDWPRMLTHKPYDPAQIVAAYGTEPDYVDFAPGYERAVAYALETIAGYLRYRADRDVVMVLLGDHQPPALVSGEGATWDVPVHVIASRPAVIERLLARGFHRGLAGARTPLGHMHELLPVLLDAFGNPHN